MNDENRREVDAANDAMHEEFDRLDPYLGPDVTKREAIDAYIADNPPNEVA